MRLAPSLLASLVLCGAAIPAASEDAVAPLIPVEAFGRLPLHLFDKSQRPPKTASASWNPSSRSS
jgi:hypothetical protein